MLYSKEKSKKFTLCALLTTLACSPLFSLQGENATRSERQIRSSSESQNSKFETDFGITANSWGRPSSFTQAAKQAIPSVVSLQVKLPVDSKQRLFSKGKESEQQDPFDFFSDEFFEHFFGGSKRGRGNSQKDLQVGQGSGFIVSSDGYIITNGHLVNKAADITVSLNDGREFKAQTIGVDPNTDIAVIKIEAETLPYLKLGNSDTLEVGQWVMAIGNPLGLQASVTVGVVSAKGRNGLDLARIEDFIQTDAAINRGNSGGPLLDLSGDVVGMNTAIVTNMGSGGYMGIGFAIPSNLIEYIAKQLVDNGSVTRGFIGVALQQVNQDLAQAFGLKKVEGALIAEVSQNSPAQKAGLKQGDVVIEQDGKKITQIGHLRNSIALMKPGSETVLTVLREGQSMAIPITVAAFQEEEKISLPTNQNEKLGIEVEPLVKDVASRLGYKENEGVLIKKVAPNSPAAWAGIQKGMLILEINRKEVKSPQDFEQQLKEVDFSKPILLLIKKGGQVHFLSLKVG